jgi:MscS family membrane protein
VVEAAGTGLAFPSQTLYLGRDEGPDPERAKAAARQVGEWRDEGTLPFPDLPAELAERISDSLDYPPRGSAAGA